MTEKRKTVLFYDKDENEERGNWAGACDFNMSVLGFALGLDNIWRFPYLTYRNGGGTFLFLYLVLMVLVGIPLFLMEASLGQFTSCGVTTCWKFAPLFKGVGISMVVVSALTGVYYNMIVGWTFRYLFASFNSDLPYLHCDNNWNTRDCRLKLPKMVCEDDVKFDDGLCKDLNGKEIGIWNKTLFHEVTGRTLMSPAQEYWEISVLESSASIEIFGSPKWDLVLCLLLAWVICFFCLIKGIKSAGKVVYFTTVCPLILLVILFIRGLTLTHASYGIYFFITPDWSKLGDVTVWKDAINHVLFSLGVASGSLISLSSYNRFHNNIVRDALIISVGDCVTCILGGFVIFSYMGYMAGQQNASIEDVSVDGVGLAFAMYPDAISSLPPPTLWAIFFFLMLVTLGIDSQFVIIETVLTGFVDQFPKMRHKKIPIISSICAISFLLGLPLTCPAGIYLVQLMDNYVSGMTLFIIAAFELVGLMYIYGVNRFCLDITLMTGIRTWIFWKISWCVISPLTIAFIFLYIFIDYEGSTYDDYTYPHWADIMGWMMTVVGVVAIPIVMAYKISIERRRKRIWQKIAFLCKPSRHWGPALRVHRALVTYVEGFIVDPPKKRRKRFVLRRLFAPQTHPDGQDERGAALVAVPIAVVSTVWGPNPNSQQDASTTELNHLPQDIEAKEESSL
ncbi:sodium- and chloride-dependent glycine transporter 2-like [Physella acuta]|uniref:sodium- and chloride-dependent glycine transporter 2-like n=1 Tax=Physella acuta TaxID=109671 RepID=UPI0027DB5D2D|nr:sodium- and chloride-dependent glycine transporter 2-like [Physella acuta]